ncbi:MAG: response regulator [Chloroflexi bacterium]|nr:MAG: response regulator [Chloroflexota bacterium]
MALKTAPQKVESVTAHILVVDDEPEIAESLSDFLTKREGYTISVAHDGKEAIDFLEGTVGTETEIDLVLLDMRMPGVSGLDVLNWIRQHPALQYTRVVLLTAASGSNEKVEALSAGADDYITKPYYPQELLARVKTILRTQQLEKQLQRQSQQLAALNQVGQKVAATLETHEVLETAVAGIDEVLGVELAAILMIESGQLRCRYVRSRHLPISPQDYPRIPLGQGLTGTVITTRRAVLFNHLQADTPFRPDLDCPPQFAARNVLAAPLIVRDRPFGVMVAFNKISGRFTEVDLDLSASLSSAIGEAIENAWLFQRIRQRQQELLESRNTLQALIDGIPHPIYTINTDWKLVAVNKSKTDELKTTAETLIGRVCYKAFFNRDTPCEHCLVHHTLNQKKSQHWSVSWLGPDHLPREWDINAYPIPATKSNSASVVILWQDRTEERRLENSLMQAGKLAAIGQLAAGVAHEINNPLTVINANAEMLKMFIPPDDENYEAVDLIARAGQRAAKVVRGLLDFARQEQYAFEPGDLNQSIQQALDLVGYQLQTADTHVHTNMADNLPPITASWEHLKSVWLNLIINARDAVQDRADNRLIEIVTRVDPENEYVQVLIRDNGKGMSEAELAHIFEPFYTTKEPGKGTGLGLATSHRIIEQHGGDINVVSAPGKGTTFVIRLPVNGNGKHRKQLT